jgi:tetratricopeptide (TPR) repeat protein
MKKYVFFAFVMVSACAEPKTASQDLHGQAMAAFADGDYIQAKKLLVKHLKNIPADQDAQRLLALINSTCNLRPATGPKVEKELRRRYEAGLNAYQLHDYVTARKNFQDVLAIRNDYRDTEKLFEECNTKLPGPTVSQAEAAKICHEGIEAFLDGNISRARILADQSLKLDSNCADCIRLMERLDFSCPKKEIAQPGGPADANSGRR